MVHSSSAPLKKINCAPKLSHRNILVKGTALRLRGEELSLHQIGRISLESETYF
jgi:hypothetical protein